MIRGSFIGGHLVVNDKQGEVIVLRTAAAVPAQRPTSRN